MNQRRGVKSDETNERKIVKKKKTIFEQLNVSVSDFLVRVLLTQAEVVRRCSFTRRTMHTNACRLLFLDSIASCIYSVYFPHIKCESRQPAHTHTHTRARQHYFFSFTVLLQCCCLLLNIGICIFHSIPGSHKYFNIHSIAMSNDER